MPQADVIFHNGPILTVDAQDTVSQAAAVTGNKISTVGSAEEVLASKGDATRVVDLAGRALVPGFNDAHTHLELTSLGLGLAVSCHTPPHESIEDILTTLSEHAAGRAQRRVDYRPGQPISGHAPPGQALPRPA